MTLLSSKQARMWIAVVLAVGQTAVITIIGRPLTTTAAPQGIISFEFARTLANAQAIIASWDTHTQIVAGLSLGIDFLYPIVYATAIALCCLAAAPHWPGSLARLGKLLSGGMILAAIFDYIENISLIQLLLGSNEASWATIAWGCAAVKFTFVLLGIVYGLMGGLFALWHKLGK
ncbi:MAG: hypothetical protein KC413_02215 [Anaerolineales bacterium]|nr:hypothetical protein [Anaerolineales bacterium]